jgi:lipid-binding SYLF domain-containing protein
MLSQNAEGECSHPAFLGMGSGSVGFQIGAEGSEVALLIMTEKGRDAMLTTEVELGGDITVAAGPVGAGAKAPPRTCCRFRAARGFMAASRSKAWSLFQRGN